MNKDNFLRFIIAAPKGLSYINRRAFEAMGEKTGFQRLLAKALNRKVLSEGEL